MWPASPLNACARRARKVIPSFSSSNRPLQFARAIRAGRFDELKLGTTLLLLAAVALAQEPALVEVRHPATGRVIALVDPAAARNHGKPLPGIAASGRLPSARLHAAVAGRAPDATVRAAARRFGLGEPERALAFQ